MLPGVGVLRVGMIIVLLVIGQTRLNSHCKSGYQWAENVMWKQDDSELGLMFLWSLVLFDRNRKGAGGHRSVLLDEYRVPPVPLLFPVNSQKAYHREL